ncbi:unnamed protein product, partial [Sphagnum balticum]
WESLNSQSWDSRVWEKVMLGRKTLHVTGEFAAVNSICEVGGSSASEDEEGCVVR